MKFMNGLTVAFAALFGTALYGCTTTGSVATSTSGIDWATTLTRTCTGLKGLDTVYKGVIAGAPTLLNADQKAAAATAETLLTTACAITPTDIPGAVASIAVASVNLGDAIAALSK